MGQSGGSRQQGTLHPPRQSGSGATSTKRQQSAQDVQRAGEADMSRTGSSRRSDEMLNDEDVERANVRRESGLDEDDSDSR